MKVIKPSKLHGEITIQGSKSVSHRGIICAALSIGKSVLENVNYCDDIYATLNALRDMGICNYIITQKKCVIEGNLNLIAKEHVNCEESGSTIRFLMPLAKVGTKFCGKGRLLKRPMDVFYNMGIKYTLGDDWLEITQQIENGEFSIRGDVSSQFISGLLFALPLKKGDSKINITTAIESLDYIELTRQMQEYFGVKSVFEGNTIYIEGNANYIARDVFVEGDYSHAAFFAVAGAINGDVLIKGLNKNSLQGDKAIFSIIEQMGGNVEYLAEGIKVSKSNLQGIEIDAGQIPDLVPILAVLGCKCNGTTKIYNAGRLRIKESDRLNSITTELNKLGANITEYEDSLIIRGVDTLKGGEVYSHDDHRIAMALTVAACISTENVILLNADAVTKSAPSFYKEISALGGVVEES